MEGASWTDPSALDAHVKPYSASGAGGDPKRRRVASKKAASGNPDTAAATARPTGLPVTIITGFLGAGKSTLLNRILNNAQGVRVAVFVNELGKIDIDGSLVAMRSKVDDTDVVLLNNGCVCCTINENLVTAVNAVLRRTEVAWLVIETTGAVDLLPLLDTFDWASEGETDLEGDVHVDGVITLVDATAFDHADFTECTAARNQIVHADVLLLNKTDLVKEDELARLEESLLAMSIEPGAGTRKPAPVLRCKFADIPLELLVDTTIFTSSGGGTTAPLKTRPRKSRSSRASAAQRQGGGKVSHLRLQDEASEFSTVSFEYADGPLDPMRFEDFVENGIPKSVYRAKGLVSAICCLSHYCLYVCLKSWIGFMPVAIAAGVAFWLQAADYFSACRATHEPVRNGKTVAVSSGQRRIDRLTNHAAAMHAASFYWARRAGISRRDF